MSRNNPLFWAFALVVLVVQLSLASPSLPPIVNVHESVESIEDVISLQVVMDELGIRTTVLHAIPEGLLSFTGEGTTLGDVTESNTLVEQIAKQTANENTFEFFCTVDPNDLTRAQTLQDCLDNGAVGLKLYNGYSYSHSLPLDDPKLTELYTMLQDAKSLLMLPVNAGEFKEELENVLTLYPDLKVICPHYCLSSKSLNRLTELMNEFPNLYVDTSFGNTAFAMTGFQTISENREAFLNFFNDFQDRILFATDNVVTSDEDKGEDFLKNLYQDYIWILSEAEFSSELEDESTDKETVYTGLALPYTTLKKVFWKNWEDLLQ